MTHRTRITEVMTDLMGGFASKFWGALPGGQNITLAILLATPLAANYLIFIIDPPIDDRILLGTILLVGGLLSVKPSIENGVFSDRGSLNPLAASITYFASMFLVGGLIGGLGISPYAHNYIGIVSNLFIGITLVAGEELLRSSFIWRFRSRPAAAILISALIIMFAGMNPIRIEGLEKGLSGITSFVNWLVTLGSLNLAAGLVVYHYGFRGGLAFRLPIMFSSLIIPVLPNIVGATAVITYSIATILTITTLAYLSSSAYDSRYSKKERPGLSIGDRTSILVALGLVILIWMSHGFLGYYAFIVVSNSMSPNIVRGDIVIIREAPIEEINVGDIILFISRDGPIVHRVVEKGVDDNNQIFLRTKGDANTGLDPDPVYEENLIGWLVITIPEVGNATLMLREAISVALDFVKNLR